MTVPQTPTPYPVRLDVDFPERRDRLTSAFRLLWVLPVLLVLVILSGDTGDAGKNSGIGVSGGLFLATLLLVLFRRKYPRWWFDFALELNRFSARVVAYALLLTDRYPSTDAEQDVHLDIDYPDAERDLNRWLPLVKWFLAIPHYVVLAFLVLAVAFGWFAAYASILVTGRYPRGLFDFTVGVGRWGSRVYGYAFLLVTDRYPPFSLR